MLIFSLVKTNLKLKLILLLIVGFFSFSFSQNVTIKGKVSDSLQKPLVNSNLLAVSKISDKNIHFTITDENGNYLLRLKQNQSYKLTVSHLGFKAQNLTIDTTTENFTQNFILTENPDELDEVVINYRPPISIKKDTITYDIDNFTTGKERKLREALKKLPGVEVDRDGNVSVNGKKITKVLVENKTFFTGDSKLAVNNIPADAVDLIQVLDNYNEITLLKGLEDSEEMAMNIKLKKDKKKFTFGDVELGGGIKNRYLIHPNLFYYSPKTNVNLIADLNNQGIKSFSFQDYLEFEGGFNKLLNDSNSYFSLFNSDFTRYLNNQNFISNTNQFGAVNIRKSITNKTDVSTYIISSNSKTNTNSNALNIYQNISESSIENRTINNKLNNFFIIGKLTLDYNPSSKESFKYNSFIKTTNNSSNSLVTTLNSSQTNTIITNTDIVSFDLKQNTNYSRKLSKTHTATLEATLNFKNDKPIKEWITDTQILQGLVPLENDTLFHISQIKKSKSFNFNTIIKDYWVLNNSNHIYISLGLNTSFNNFFNEDLQQLSDGAINNFNSAGFNNDFKYNFLDMFLGLEYKFKIGITTFKPSIYYHNYLWNTRDEREKSKTFSKNLFLPKFTSKTVLNNSEKINFKYQLKARFPSINQLIDNFILSSFNSVFRGNSDLENQLYHSISAGYYRFSLFKDLNLNININYNRRLKAIKNTTDLSGIEFFNTPIIFDQPEQNLIFNTRIIKKINNFKYKFATRFNYNDFFQLLNNNVDLNISKSISYTLGVETLFEKFPTLEINYTKDFNNYKNRNSINNFENDQLEINLEHNLCEDFILTAYYKFENYKNETNNITNLFNTANASLYYQKEDSPWGFEINASNIFNIKFRQQNSFSNFLISDRTTFILPRIIMFKLNYKL